MTHDTASTGLSARGQACGEHRTVTFNGGQNPQQWDVAATLSEVTPQPGRTGADSADDGEPGLRSW